MTNMQDHHYRNDNDDEFRVAGEMIFDNAQDYESYLDGRLMSNNGFRDKEGRLGRQPNFEPYVDEEESAEENDDSVDPAVVAALTAAATAAVLYLAEKVYVWVSDESTQQKMHRRWECVVAKCRQAMRSIKCSGNRIVSSVKGLWGKSLQAEDVLAEYEEKREDLSEEVVGKEEEMVAVLEKDLLADIKTQETEGIELSQEEIVILLARFMDLLQHCTAETRELLYLWQLLSHATVREDVERIQSKYVDTLPDSIRTKAQVLVECKAANAMPEFSKALEQRLQVEQCVIGRDE